jgi:hypothetical protein
MNGDKRFLVYQNAALLAKTLPILKKHRCRLIHQIGGRLAVVALAGNEKQILKTIPRGVYLLENAEKAERVLGKMDLKEALALGGLRQPSPPPTPPRVRTWEEEGFGGCDAD